MPRLLDVLEDSQTLLPAVSIPLPATIRHTNEAAFDAEWTNHLLNEAYAERVANVERVDLGRIPAGTVLGGAHHFILWVDNETVADTLPHALRGDCADALAALRISEPLPANFNEECLLLARYGHGTWGHWLGEILPAAVAAERSHPGRFRFLVPAHSGAYGIRLRASLAAYGIGIDRIIVTDGSRPLRLSRAWCVSPIWSDHIPHPMAIELLRTTLTTEFLESSPTVVALTRREWHSRGIANANEIIPFLEATGFREVDVAALPFLGQVALFRTARRIFSVIGSGLTGLIYSPDGVEVLAAGPARWGDRFFYALGQLRAARWVEVRGPSSWNGCGEMRDAPFTIAPAALAEGLSKL